MRPADKVLKLVLVHASERNRVDFDLEPGMVSRIDAAHHLSMVAPACDCPELVGVERVERHVDALDVALGKFRRITGELAAVGGERQLVEPVAEMPGKLLD